MEQSTYSNQEKIVRNNIVSRDANWYIEQLLCGEWEQYVESGFEEEVQRLLKITDSPKVRRIIKEGLFQYWYGEKWESLFDATWIPFMYGDHTIKLPLDKELVIIDSPDIIECSIRKYINNIVSHPKGP